MNAFRLFIEKYTPISDEDWAQVARCFESRIINKGELLLCEGQVCRHLYFLESGLLRYFITRDGTAFTKFFTIAPYCFTSQVSFTSGKPATETIEALETSVIWQSTLQQTNALFALNSWSTFVRKLIQEVQFFTEELLQDMQAETAEHRYEQLLLANSELLQRVPLMHLASFLGIAPQSLSRIRKKIGAKHRT